MEKHGKTWEQVADMFERSIGSVKTHYRMITGPNEGKRQEWTREELKMMHDGIADNMPDQEICELFPTRSRGSVISKLKSERRK